MINLRRALASSCSATIQHAQKRRHVDSKIWLRPLSSSAKNGTSRGRRRTKTFKSRYYPDHENIPPSEYTTGYEGNTSPPVSPQIQAFTANATASVAVEGPFRPLQADSSEFESFDDYLESVPLSPWVPTPEPVARRMLQLADANPNDVHYDLGSGDGRMNLMAIDLPFAVQKTVGYEVDVNLLARAEQRLKARHPRPENVQFVQCDLLSDEVLLQNAKKGSKSLVIPWKECTLLTMYFVGSALEKLRPLLEEQLGGSGCRVVTNGYAVRGWEPEWMEVVLGSKLFLYKL